MNQERKGGLVVEMRPQITVEMNNRGEVVISTSGIADDFEHVEINDIAFPVECAEDVANAILELVANK